MPAPPSPTAAFPQLGTRFVDENGSIEIPWYRLLIQLWRLIGGSNVPIANAVYFILNLPSTLQVWSISTGGLVGVVALQDTPGKPAVPQAPAVSPFVFTAAGSGMFSGFCCKMELSRDAGVTYYPLTLTGGAVPMLKADKIRLSWLGASPPTAVWFPSD